MLRVVALSLGLKIYDRNDINSLLENAVWLEDYWVFIQNFVIAKILHPKIHGVDMQNVIH